MKFLVLAIRWAILLAIIAVLVYWALFTGGSEPWFREMRLADGLFL